MHVDGFDMRLGQCPPAEMWPKNAAFYAYNFTQDVPSEFQNKYDVLHVRLVMGGLQDTPAPALKNFFKMLSMHRAYGHHFLNANLFVLQNLAGICNGKS